MQNYNEVWLSCDPLQPDITHVHLLGRSEGYCVSQDETNLVNIVCGDARVVWTFGIGLCEEETCFSPLPLLSRGCHIHSQLCTFSSIKTPSTASPPQEDGASYSSSLASNEQQQPLYPSQPYPSVPMYSAINAQLASSPVQLGSPTGENLLLSSLQEICMPDQISPWSLWSYQ